MVLVGAKKQYYTLVTISSVCSFPINIAASDRNGSVPAAVVDSDPVPAHFRHLLQCFQGDAMHIIAS